MASSDRFTGRPDSGTDPDAMVVRSTARGIGLRVAWVAFALVAVGGAAFFIVLWWKAGGTVFGHSSDDVPDPDGGYVTVSLNTVDLVTATVTVGLLAVVAAGLSAVLIARRAVAPLAEALHREQRFVADASHELRTPLSILHARVQQLSMQTPDDDPGRQTVDALREDSTVLVQIVDDLLDGATPAGREVGTTDLDVVLNRLREDLGVLADRQGVELEVTTVDARVQMPAADLSRCLTALVDNAIRHTSTGGHVRVTATASPAPRRREVVLTVVDDGTGIRGIDPDRVFDRFAHGSTSVGDIVTGRGSHGIGLFLVRELVHRAGGSVALVSTGHSGTVFTVRLPTSSAPATKDLP